MQVNRKGTEALVSAFIDMNELSIGIGFKLVQKRGIRCH